MAEYTVAVVDDSDKGQFEVTINFTANLQKETFTPSWNPGTASNLVIPRTGSFGGNRRITTA